MLIVGAILMAGAGLAFASDTQLHLSWWLAGTIGVISPSGNEVGPFLSIEQAALSQVIPTSDRTDGLCVVHTRRRDRDCGGLPVCRVLTQALQKARVDSSRERSGYHLSSMPLWDCCSAVLFSRLSPAAEAHPDGGASHSPEKLSWDRSFSRRVCSGYQACLRSMRLAAASWFKVSPPTGFISVLA